MSGNLRQTEEARINYLRVSVTDRCNFRCVYCMPEQGVPALKHVDMLRYEEIVRVVRLAVAAGVSKVRLTGGEPLVRRGVVELVRKLAALEGLQDLALTTNGAYLADFAVPLVNAGLRRVNVSLDTLNPDRFRIMTRGGELWRTLSGIRVARESGLDPVKVNVVVLRQFNLDEVVDFAELAWRERLQVRFIEYMPMGECGEAAADQFVPNAEVRRCLETRFALEEPATPPDAGDTARVYSLAGGKGGIGFISPLSKHFCASCNRLRLTSDGRLRVCLRQDAEIDLRSLLRSSDDAAVLKAFQDAIQRKRVERGATCPVADWGRKCAANMSRIGG